MGIQWCPAAGPAFKKEIPGATQTATSHKRLHRVVVYFLLKKKQSKEHIVFFFWGGGVAALFGGHGHWPRKDQAPAKDAQPVLGDRVGLFGLGTVGMLTAALLLEHGHQAPPAVGRWRLLVRPNWCRILIVQSRAAPFDV